MRDQLLQQADKYMKQGPPPYHIDPKDHEQLWQRAVGDSLPVLALAQILTHDPKYLQAVTAWSQMAISYPLWGEADTDLSAGHILYGLGLVYDWCYSDLSPDLRLSIRQTVAKRGNEMFQAIRDGKQNFLQNHLWVNLTGLSTSTFAMVDEEPEFQPWLELAKADFQKSLSLLGPDGASHEGASYWDYGVEYLLNYMDLSRELLGIDLFNNDWFRKTAYYRIYLSLPQNVWKKGIPGPATAIVDLEDSVRSDWYGPDFLLRKLAHEYRIPQAQWLAQALDDSGINQSDTWKNILWFDPNAPSSPLSDLPTLRSFDDLGIISSRSDWSGSESLLVAKCGPALGHSHMDDSQSLAGSASHVHPDAGTFCLFGSGRFLIRNAGYQVLKKTAYDNTLLIDGQGQWGDGAVWFSASHPADVSLKVLKTTSEYDYLLADATAAYDPAKTGLQLFQRRFIFLKKKNVVLVLDQVQLSGSHKLELNFHPEIAAVKENTGTGWISQDEHAKLLIQPLGEDAQASFSNSDDLVDHKGNKMMMPTFILISPTASNWQEAVAFSWSSVGQGDQPLRVTAKHQSGSPQWEFTLNDGTKVAIDTQSDQVVIR